MLAALYLVFMVVPTEASMGIVQRIFYFHVPSAIVAFGAFFVVGGAGVVYLFGRGAGADRLASASAEVGMLFCTLVLVTGPLWAKPAWGVWWQEDDPNLRFSIILWTIYAGYLMLRAFGGEDDAVKRFAAVVGIIGALAIPIGMIAVRMRRSIHPVLLARREGGTGLTDPWMQLAFLVSFVAIALLAGWLIHLRTREAWLTDEVAALRRQAVDQRGEMA